MAERYVLVWNDEEPQYSVGALKQFEQNWEVHAFRNPNDVLQHFKSPSNSFERTILVVDLMMPFFDDTFTDDSTRGGFLTGLQLLKILDERDRLAGLAGTFIYSVLAEEALRQEVTGWIDGVKSKNHRIRFVSKGDVLFHEFPKLVQETVEGWADGRGS